MSVRMELLKQLKSQTVKPEVICTPGPNCWCAQITTIIDIPTDNSKCFTPREILDNFGDELTTSDQQYLETLLF